MTRFLCIASHILLASSLFLGLSVVPVAVAQAEILQVEYKSFYSHVRKLKGDDTQALQFAFGFINVHTKDLCTVKEARISTEKQQIALQVSAENRFTVPSEKALNLAKALVVIELAEAANICDMSVQLETKPEYLKLNYSQEELMFLYEQYTAFFDEMGSFLSFMMPKVTGLTLYFKDKSLNIALSSELLIKNGSLALSENQLSNLKHLNLPQPPLRITAVTSK